MKPLYRLNLTIDQAWAILMFISSHKPEFIREYANVIDVSDRLAGDEYSVIVRRLTDIAKEIRPQAGGDNE